MLPRFDPPSPRTTRYTGTFIGGIKASAPTNTCGCSGDKTYNQCSVTRNDCQAGFYPQCHAGDYNCGCTCLPVSA